MPGHKIIAIDYGRRRIGVAGCHEDVPIAFGLDTLILDNLDEIPARIGNLLAERESNEVVLGLPISLGDRPGELCGEIIALAEALQTRGFVVHLVDEALSSRRAADVLRQRGKRPRKEDHDRVSAALLLQEYLDGRLPEFSREQIENMKKVISV
jgi:putative Holliday junction resolvase